MVTTTKDNSVRIPKWIAGILLSSSIGLTGLLLSGGVVMYRGQGRIEARLDGGLKNLDTKLDGGLQNLNRRVESLETFRSEVVPLFFKALADKK